MCCYLSDGCEGGRVLDGRRRRGGFRHLHYFSEELGLILHEYAKGVNI